MSERPIVLVTNDDGVRAPGLAALVSVLVQAETCDVFVCAPQEEKSACAHSITVRDSLEVGRVEIEGATAWEVTGTPVDCVSLALSAHLLPRKPALVISGINKGSNCGLHIIYSGTVGGAREAFMSGVPSIAISLDWKRGVSSDAHFREAAESTMPLISAKLRDIDEKLFPRGCFFNVDVPTEPKKSRGFKTTRQGTSRITPNWVKVTRRKSGAQMAGAKALPGMVSMGAQLAQIGLQASAMAAARRRAQTGSEVEEVNSIQGTDKWEKEYFRNEMGEYDEGEPDEDIDYVALSQGWITITPLALSTQAPPEALESARAWLALNVSDN